MKAYDWFQSNILRSKGMSLSYSSKAAKSLHRRLRFATASKYKYDSFLRRVGLPWHPLLRDIPLFSARITFDLIEGFRSGAGFGHLGRAYLDGLSAPLRLPQFPRYPSYWFDARRHALVGMVIGLDLIFYEGRHYVVEANLGAGISEDRRALYPTRLDPFITAMIEVARAEDFERIVFCHHRWSSAYVEEFAAATEASGIEVIGASFTITDDVSTHSMVALPDPLQEKTIYVIFPVLGTPLTYFMHNKLIFAHWLKSTIETNAYPIKKLAFIPTSDELIIPPEPADQRWPNLVAKLANRDKGKFVVMGRFRTVQEARAALLLKGPKAVPGIFKLGLFDRLKERIFPRHEPIYQQFIPPRIIDGRACKTRPLVFISPLLDQFLSAHATKSRKAPPTDLKPGQVDASGAYNVSHFGGGEYITVSAAEQDELRAVAQEFGSVAKIAITEKFETGPSEF